MKLRYSILTALLLLATAGVRAQTDQPGEAPPPRGNVPNPHTMGMRPPGGAPMGGSLFLPDLIMQHQTELNLSTNQETAIKAELQKSQARLMDLQWQLQTESKKLADLVKPDRVDEAATQAQLDKVLALENDVKKAHLTTLIHIKNQLTAEQQAKLRTLRPQPPERRPGPAAGAPAEGPGRQAPPPQAPPSEDKK